MYENTQPKSSRAGAGCLDLEWGGSSERISEKRKDDPPVLSKIDIMPRGWSDGCPCVYRHGWVKIVHFNEQKSIKSISFSNEEPFRVSNSPIQEDTRASGLQYNQKPGYTLASLTAGPLVLLGSRHLDMFEIDHK